MKHITVITPLALSSAELIPATAASLGDAAALIPDVTVDWRIQIDGPVATEAHAQTIKRLASENLPTVHHGKVEVGFNGFQAGSAVTRTIALHTPVTPASDWIITLDGDDIVLPTAFAKIREVASENPDAKWVVGGALVAKGMEGQENPTISRDWQGKPREELAEPDLWDGEMPTVMANQESGIEIRNYAPLISVGAQSSGAILDWAMENNRFPIFAAFAAYRTSVILEAGGWLGVPTGADAVLLAGVSENHPGYIMKDPTFIYRQHPNQNTRSTWFARNRRVQWQVLTGIYHGRGSAGREQ